MSKHYDQYLKELHKRNQTPDETIQGIVREATGKEIKEKQRIVAGEANEVYRITTTGGLVVFLRIARKNKPEFLQEVWAINQAKMIGLPVPEVLLVKHLTVDGQLISFCVQRELPGQVMERGSFDFHKLDKITFRKLMNQAGLLLSKIHSIKTNGFGDINEFGDGKYSSFTKLWYIDSNLEEKYYELADKLEIPRYRMKQISEVINSRANRQPCNVPSILNHGDYGLKHLMYDGKNICGILDWGEVNGNSPIYDLVRWDYWFGDEIPTEWLIEGYGNMQIISTYKDDLCWLRLITGLGVLWWYAKQNYPEAIETAKVKLLDDLNYILKHDR